MTAMPTASLDSLRTSPSARGRLVTASGETPTVWKVAEEVPVAILLNGSHFAVMMATPSDLEDFALGFALTEGIVQCPEQIAALRLAEAAEGLVVNLRLDPARVAAVEDRRRLLAGRSGCGICGAQTIAAMLPRPRRVPRCPAPSLAVLQQAYEGLPGRQAMNRLNHSTHAAAFCDPGGAIIVLREDIGRHNALDKLAGALLRERQDPARGFILLSSRVSVELVQKAAALGTPFLAAVSAPSALALRVASQAGMGIAGRAREGIMIFEGSSLAEGGA